ncbi:hypothetical protein O181_040334 [Austropuccinia psidii MF-1]|uniref:Uncharacterized protein n=1 Tax=Austropuccinia psidii MF-1 TaxID=1389203 RepID=A0A9Q3HFE8_9BASI|nr:hypothetical protein [Austropuccinia psidii MF-1]
MSPEPESIFDICHHSNITGDFTDQKKVNKKVVTSLFAEVDAFTKVNAISLAKEEVAYEDALVAKLREALKKF